MFVRRGEANNPADAVKAETKSQTLVADNPERVTLYVTNDGANVVYLALGPTAVKNEGIRLNANGGSFTDQNYKGVVSVVTAEGESVVTFAEV